MTEIGLPTIAVRERSSARCSLRLLRPADDFPFEQVSQRYTVFEIGGYTTMLGDVVDEIPPTGTFTLSVGSLTTKDVEVAPGAHEYTNPPALRWVADARSFGFNSEGYVDEWYPTIGDRPMDVAGDASYLSDDASIPQFGYRSSDGWIESDALNLSAGAFGYANLRGLGDKFTVLLVGTFSKSWITEHALALLGSGSVTSELVVTEDNLLGIRSSADPLITGPNLMRPGTVTAMLLSVDGTNVQGSATVGSRRVRIGADCVQWDGIGATSVSVMSGSLSDVNLLEVAVWAGDDAYAQADSAGREICHYYYYRGRVVHPWTWRGPYYYRE